MKYVTETVSFQVIVYNICKASAWRRKEITRDLSPIQLLEKRVSLISFYVVAQKMWRQFVQSQCPSFQVLYAFER